MARAEEYGVGKFEAAERPFATTEQELEEIMEKADQGASRELGPRSRDLAKDAAMEALDRANEIGTKGLHKVAATLDRAAHYLGENGHAEGAEVDEADRGRMAHLSDGIQGAASYLREHDPKSLASEVDRVIRDHPYRALAVGVGLGWLIGRLGGRD